MDCSWSNSSSNILDLRFMPAGTNFTKSSTTAKWIYVSKKESCLFMAGKFIYKTLKNAGKS